MKTKKRVVTIALVAALMALLIGGATMAYFTDTDAKDNVFEVGDVDIELVEPNWVTPSDVTPGVEYKKDPYVKNIGENDAWIRVNVTLSDWTAFKAAAANHSITDLTTIFGGFQNDLWTLTGTPAVDTSKDTVTYSYYYNTAVAAGDNTAYLFQTVTVPKEFTSAEMEALGDDFTITIKADAIQKDTFATPAAAFANF